MALNPKKINILYKVPRVISSNYSTDNSYQFLQQSQIPTMHFQKSLPRLPIPKLELTCERYLAAQRPLLIEEAYRKTETHVNQFKQIVGKQLQDMLKSYDRQHKNTSYISQMWFDYYLSDRKPIPINYNPMLVMHDDERPEYNTQLIRATNLIISILRFYKSLQAGNLEPEIYHLDPRKSDTEWFKKICSSLPPSLSSYGAYIFKAFPLDMSQYPNLFNTTRIPEIDKDRLVTNLKGQHITIQHKGHFYAFRVLSPENDILPREYILAGLKQILDTSVKKCEHPIGILTTLERNKWATIRHELAEFNKNNSNVLKYIDSALFNVCLDDVNVKSDPYAITRNFLHGDGDNRWFDKSFSLQISQDGVSAVNFEHAWGDGVAVLRLLQDIFKDSKENPQVNSNTDSSQVNLDNLLRLDIDLNQKFKNDIREAQNNYKNFCSSLDIDYLIFDRMGKKVCKNQAISPDALMQLAFQMAYHKMSGKFVPTYESCSTAAFKHGRTETMRPLTTATKAFCLAINLVNNSQVSKNELKIMIADCSRIHSQLTREAAMGQGFDRHLFALKHFAEKINMHCNIFDDPDYAYLNKIILSTSTLNSPAMYAGGFGPVVKDGLGIGYSIKDNELGVLCTSYPPYQNGSDFMESLTDSFNELLRLLEN